MKERKKTQHAKPKRSKAPSTKNNTADPGNTHDMHHETPEVVEGGNIKPIFDKDDGEVPPEPPEKQPPAKKENHIPVLIISAPVTMTAIPIVFSL